MSIPPPGYETPQASRPSHAPLGQAAPPIDGDVTPRPASQQPDAASYEFKSVQALRGRVGNAKTKWQQHGWELVSERQGTARTTLTFRRVKPEPLGARILRNGATLRRIPPKTLLVALLLCALMLGAGVTGILAGPQSEGETAGATPTPQAAASPAAPDDRPVTDITVDELLRKLNAGEPETGERFRFTGELSGSQYWTTGASGDFTVSLKAEGGANDLNVFVEESDAAEWQNGTRVEMVVSTVEITVDGETTPGFLRAASVRTLSGGTTKEATAGDTEQELLSALSTYAETLNESAGAPFIDSIDPGSADGVVHVRLGPAIASMSIVEAQTSIRTMNGQIVEIARELAPDQPMIRFFLAGDAVAENRYLLDPDDVKFQGVLDR